MAREDVPCRREDIVEAGAQQLRVILRRRDGDEHADEPALRCGRDRFACGLGGRRQRRILAQHPPL